MKSQKRLVSKFKFSIDEKTYYSACNKINNDLAIYIWNKILRNNITHAAIIVSQQLRYNVQK